MNDLHEVVQRAKELYSELGRTPLRLEIQSSGISSYAIQKHGYEKVLSLAGLNPHSHGEARMLKKNEKITNQIFERNIIEDIDNYSPKTSIKTNNFSKILCWPDSHYPFANKEAEAKMIQFAIENQPDYIIQVGDLLDCYAASKFPRSQNIYTPKEEERLGIEMAQNAWKKLREGCPKAKCYQLMGNHDVRILKRTLESLPIAEHWIEAYFKQLFSFEGVETIFDTRQELEIDGILFTHGFLSSGSHKDYYLKNVIHGHDHKLYVMHRRIHGQNIFEMSCGFIGDIESKPLSYTSSKLANFQLGFGWVDQSSVSRSSVNKKSSLNELDEAILPYLKANKDKEIIHKLFSYPAKFQASLPESIIQNFTRENDLVLDPFSGGGTTSAEALKQGRKSFAMDLNPISVLVSRAKTTKITSSHMKEITTLLEGLKRPLKFKDVTPQECELLGKELSDFAESIFDLVRKNKNKGYVNLLATCAIKRIKLSTRRDKEHLRTAPFSDHVSYALDEINKVYEYFSNLPKQYSENNNQVEYGSNHDIPLTDSSVKLIITSPPYPGVDIEYNLIQLQRRDLNRCYRSNIAQRMSEVVISCPYSPTKKNLCNGGVETDDYWFNAKKSLAEMHRVLKKGGRCFLYIGFKEDSQKKLYEKVLRQTGFEIEESYNVELGNERVASSRGTFHGRDTKMMKSDILFVLRK